MGQLWEEGLVYASVCAMFDGGSFANSHGPTLFPGQLLAILKAYDIAIHTFL